MVILIPCLEKQTSSKIYIEEGVLVIECESAESLHEIKCDTYGELLAQQLPYHKVSYRYGDIDHTLSLRKFNF